MGMKEVKDVISYLNKLIKDADRDTETASKLSQRIAGKKKAELLRRIRDDVKA
jgi:hypothetical protein